MYTNNDHTFVICAYKQSPYLKYCLFSLLNQTLKANILIETSTPCDYILSLAEEYKIPVVINNGENGCAQDWNFGYNSSQTKLVTIAHQDDIYDDTFLEETLSAVNKAQDPILVYTDYYEIRKNKKTTKNTILTVKRILNRPLKKISNWQSKQKRNRILSFGDAISCPTVTLVKDKCGLNPYDTTYKCSCDYKTWSNLAKLDGSFAYIPKLLMGHRIYEESHTSIYLSENIRQQEDFEIISSYWPKSIGKIMYKFYSKSQNSNKL